MRDHRWSSGWVVATHSLVPTTTSGPAYPGTASTWAQAGTPARPAPVAVALRTAPASATVPVPQPPLRGRHIADGHGGREYFGPGHPGIDGVDECAGRRPAVTPGWPGHGLDGDRKST